jgi:hypothetical protein
VRYWGTIESILPAVEVVHEKLNFLLILFFIFFTLGIILLDSIPINHDLEIAGTDVNILSKDNFLTNTFHGVNLTENGC